jgi:hypothetical protein
MLFKFKSRATADLIMLEPSGRRVLEIIGKNPDDAHGIVTQAQIPAAIDALEAAVRADDEARAAPAADNAADADDEGQGAQRDTVSLRQRAAPFIDMLRRSAAEDCDVVW